MMTIIAAIGLIGLTGTPSPSAGAVSLSPAAEKAFRRYVQTVEASADARGGAARPFLWADDSKERVQRVRAGVVVIERSAGTEAVQVEGGLIHDWIGSVFIPGVTLADTLALVQDYDRHKTIYPEVIDSKLLHRQGDRFEIFLKLRKKKVITAVLKTWHDAEYTRLDSNRVRSWSRTTRVVEVDNAGTPEERDKEPGTEHGFMWFLNSYWRFAERDGGVYIECQAVSLSRGIPFGFGWLIGGVVNDLPRQSLEGTLRATRDALLKTARGRP